MELREFIKIISMGRKTILLTTLVFVAVVAIYSVLGYGGIKGSYNLYIIPQGEELPISEVENEFNVDLDQFYRLRAADLTARMVR